MVVTKTHPIKRALKAAIDKGTNLGRHLIFNAVSFADHKHYHSNKRS